MASDVTITGALQNAQNTQQQSVTLAEDFSQFLTLLTTQLQNQDPLSPMDSTEFTNQLVQFSQVEQQINSNKKLDNLVQLQLASVSNVALGYVGLDISYISAASPVSSGAGASSTGTRACRMLEIGTARSPTSTSTTPFCCSIPRTRPETAVLVWIGSSSASIASILIV